MVTLDADDMDDVRHQAYNSVSVQSEDSYYVEDTTVMDMERGWAAAQITCYSTRRSNPDIDLLNDARVILKRSGGSGRQSSETSACSTSTTTSSWTMWPRCR
jgi:hypothetical protein